MHRSIWDRIINFPYQKAKTMNNGTISVCKKTENKNSKNSLMKVPAYVGAILLWMMMMTTSSGLMAQGSTLQNWTPLYNNVSTSQQTISYSVPAGSGSNRMLMVAIASSQSSAASRTVSISYGGQNLTLAAGNMDVTTIRQHTAIYYLNEAGLDLASNSNLVFTVSNGTTRVTTVWAAVFDYVNQSSPITNTQNYSNASAVSTFSFGTNLTVNASNQAIVVISSVRNNNTGSRTTTYPTNFSLVDEETWSTTDGVRNGVANRTIPSTNTTDACAVTFSGNALPSMTGVSINLCAAPTANAGAALTAICKGGTSAALGGSVGGSATGGTWSDGGAGGSFSPNATTLNATYIPAASYTGTATLTLTSSGGSCGVATASKTLAVNPTPTAVTAVASSTTICSGNSINLTSSATSNSGLTGSVFSESFNGAISTWTLSNSSTGGTPANAAWTLRSSGYNDGNETFNTPDASQFILTSSDLQGDGGTTNTSLTSPAFSTTGMSAANINLSHYYRYNSGTSDRAFVEVSTNGTSWTTLTTYSSTQGTASAFATPTIALTAGFLNQSTVYVRFRYTATFDWYWSINSVSVSGTFTSAPAATFSWASSPAGYTSSSQNPTGVSPTASTTYTVTATNSYGCTATASTSLVTVNTTPTVASVTDGTRCGSGTVALSATTQAGSTIDWYQNATGGTPLSGGTGVTSFTTPSISASAVYHAQARNTTTGCTSADRTAVTATVSNPPAVSNQSGSSTYGAATTYTISATNATSYSATGLPTGFTLNTTSGIITIAADAPAGNYSIAITAIAPGCTNASATLTYTRNTANLTITANNVIKCYGTNYTMGTTAFGSAGLQAGDVISSVTLSSDGSGIFADLGTYAIVPSGASGASFNASNYSITYTNGTMTVVDVPAFTQEPSVTSQAVCQNETAASLTVAAVAGSGSITGYQWYVNTANSSFGGTLISGATAATLTPSTATAGTFYYYCIVTNSNNCTALSNVSGALVINALPTIVTVTGGGAVCNNTLLSASNGSSGTIYFQGTTSNGTSTATPSTSQTISASGTYYFRAQSAAGCWGPQGSVVVTIQAPQVTGVEICQGAASQSLTSSTSCPELTNQASGPRDAGTGENITGVGTVAWTNPGNLTTAGTPFAGGMSVGSGGTVTTNYLRATNYGFSIPSNATITGITLVINRSSSGTATPYLRDNEVKLVKGGVIQTSNKALTTTDWSNNNVMGTATYGGSSDLWGTTWTPAQINATNFGAVLSARNASTGNNRTANVDYMRVTVTYSLPGELNWFTQSSGGTSIGTGSSFNPVGVANSGLINTNTSGSVPYYVECTSNPGCRGTANFVINPAPTVSSVNDGSRCGTGTVDISASASAGATIDWYGVSTGGSVLSGGTGVTSFTTPGISSTTTYYAQSRNTTTGCVSLARTAVNAVVNSASSSSTNVTVCSNQLPYSWNGNNYNTAGSYNVTLTNAAGCDSIATLVLTINNTSTSTTNITRCSNQLPYSWNGNNYSAAGTYNVTLTNAANCDSVATLVLTVNQTSSSTTNVTICSNELPYAWNGTNYNAAGTYTYTTTNAAGCDSVATLNLTVNNTSSSTTNLTVCSSQLPYSWNGNSYNSSGTYSVTLGNAHSCDSIATLVLTVNNTSISTTNVTVCSNQLPYSWNGSDYSTAGTYTYTTTNAAGCDSVATLILAINQTSVSTTNVTVCSNQLPYNWNGNNYSSAGTYNVTLTNAANCDSVATLVLTVNQTSSSTTNVTICSNELPYSWNGTNYNAAGTYTYTTTNAAGCDSVATLNLTVNSTSGSTANVSICFTQLPYNWNGTDYNAAGTYTFTSTNAAGCDSVATLNLSVATPTTMPEVVTACDSYSWNGQSYTVSGTYTFATACGADTLVLTINNSTHDVYTDTACGSYTWNGNAYTASGVYVYNYTNNLGCASADTLYLTVNPLPTVPGAVTGVTEVCTLVGNTTPTVYATTGVLDAVSYNWIVPTGVTIVSGQGSTSVGVTFTNALASSNQMIRVASVSDKGCYSAYSNIILSKTIPSIPAAINGPTNACAYIGQNTTATYTADTVVNAISYVWVAPAGATIVSGQGTSSIELSYQSSFTSGSLKVTAVGNCGSRTARSLTISRLIPAVPVSISGPASVCNVIGTNTQVTYSVASVANATSYTWSLPSGVNLISGQGTTSIVVTFSSSYTTNFIRVNAVSNCFTTGFRSLQVSAATYGMPGVITGPTNACPFIANDALATYTIRKVANAGGYIWTVPTGVTIIQRPGTGANDTIIRVSYNTNYVSGSNILVQATGCGVSAPRSLAVNGIIVSTPGLISGPTNVCQFMVSASQPSGNIATYTIRKVAGATAYDWDAPDNASIIGHPGGNAENDTIVQVKFEQNFVSGTLEVSAGNACGGSGDRSLTISRLNPSTPSNIDVVQTSVCPNRVFTYTISSMPANATSVVWTVPSVGTIVSGQGTTSITVSYPPTVISGEVTAQSVNNCSSSAIRSVKIKLSVCPSSFTSNTSGQAGKTTDITLSGVEPLVYPNPSQSDFKIVWNTGSAESCKITIRDMQGRNVGQYLAAANRMISVGQQLKPGNYIIEIVQGTVRRTMKVVKL